MKPSEKRIETALKSLNAESWANQRGKIPAAQLVEMLLCDMQRASEVLTGEAYYDYDAQVWIDAEKEAAK
jgi:hypothetical protein